MIYVIYARPACGRRRFNRFEKRTSLRNEDICSSRSNQLRGADRIRTDA